MHENNAIQRVSETLFEAEKNIFLAGASFSGFAGYAGAG